MFKKLLYLSFFVSFNVSAAQTCKGYINDEWIDARYTVSTVNGETTVLDQETNLMWKQCAEGLSGAGCDQGQIQPFTWLDALAVPEGTNYGGHQDWRVPNINELASIVAYNCVNPSINETAFPNTFPFAVSYWTSTPRAAVANQVRKIYFYDGTETAVAQGTVNYLRLVRTN